MSLILTLIFEFYYVSIPSYIYINVDSPDGLNIFLKILYITIL